MKKILQFQIILFICPILFLGHTLQDNRPTLKGPYLGQKPPGTSPVIFAPNIVSTEEGELNIIVSPDGKEIYFCRAQSGSPTVIMVTRMESQTWSAPKIVSFSGTYSDMDPSLSADGSMIFFGSTRPSGRTNARGCDIWMVKRPDPTKDWSNPVNLGGPVNTLENENYPTTSKGGTLFFHSQGHEGLGGLDIFCSDFKDGQYLMPENLGEAVNSEHNDFDAYVARDESYLIFSSNGRSDGFGSGDLYVSYHKTDGSWTKAKNMGAAINSSSMEYCPSISPDEKYFFFSSGRSGNGDIYWMDAGVIEEMKPAGLKARIFSKPENDIQIYPMQSWRQADNLKDN